MAVGSYDINKQRFYKTERKDIMSKLRVWHIPQVPMKSFYIPVETVEEGKKVMDTLAAYDLFQFENHVKPDFANASGLQMFDEEEQEWCDWYIETDKDYFDNVDDYCEGNKVIEQFSNEMFSQLKQHG